MYLETDCFQCLSKSTPKLDHRKYNVLHVWRILFYFWSSGWPRGAPRHPQIPPSCFFGFILHFWFVSDIFWWTVLLFKGQLLHLLMNCLSYVCVFLPGTQAILCPPVARLSKHSCDDLQICSCYLSEVCPGLWRGDHRLACSNKPFWRRCCLPISSN